MKYTVHLYREMCLRFDGVEAETPEAAAKLASEKQLPEADDFNECDGLNLAALVDVEGDEEFAQSSVVDLELEIQQKRMRVALETIARLQMDGFKLTNDDAVDTLHSCIRLAREALAVDPAGLGEAA